MAALIGVQEVLEHLRAVVAEKGADYVYDEEACQYAIDGQPACIVGHVYARFGLLDEETQWSGDRAHKLHISEITAMARRVLRTAQQVQDGDLPPFERGMCGEALAAAEAQAAQAGA